MEILILIGMLVLSALSGVVIAVIALINRLLPDPAAVASRGALLTDPVGISGDAAAKP